MIYQLYPIKIASVNCTFTVLSIFTSLYIHPEVSQVRLLLSSVKNEDVGTSLEVQWLRLCISNAGVKDSVSGWGTKIPRAAWQGQRGKR